MAQADTVIVPSMFARERLRALGAPLPWERVHVLAPPVRALAIPPGTATTPAHPVASAVSATVPGGSPTPTGEEHVAAGAYALVVSRLAPEKGVDVAIDACRAAGIALVVAGDGPERAALEARARVGDREVRFLGHVDDARLAALRAGAAVALVPSRSAETFGLAAAEAMAAGLPVVGQPGGRAARAGRGAESGPGR